MKAFPVYTPRPDRERRIESAKRAIATLLPVDLFLPHKRELLDICIWKLTEVDGKWNVRYWSQGMVDIPNAERRHEHVYERKELIERLLEGEDVESVSQNAIACIVTKEEHRKLSKASGSGWVRYSNAGVAVFDAGNGLWVNRS